MSPLEIKYGKLDKVGNSILGDICEDIDECRNPGACGLNQTCTNKVGSYSCACQRYKNIITKYDISNI